MTTLHNLAKQIGASLLAHEWQLGLAESCTGGLAAATITDLAGSSAWFDSSAVVYSNQAKQD
jgi:nicotinamide-nucleotide amidase